MFRNKLYHILFSVITMASCNNLYHHENILLPEIIYTYPEQDAPSIETNKSIMIAFNKQMDTSSINNLNLKLISENRKDIKGTLRSHDRRIIIFDPEKDLQKKQKYSFYISGDIMDITGRKIQNGMEIGFTTADRPDMSAPEIRTIDYKYNIRYDIHLTAIVFVFSKDMDPVTINRNTISIFYRDMKIKGEIEYVAETRKAVFKVEQKITDNEGYRILILSGQDSIRDLAGVSLIKDHLSPEYGFIAGNKKTGQSIKSCPCELF